MCSLNHNTAARCAGTSRNNVVLFLFTRRSTREITADGPWSSRESIRFRKMAHGTLGHSVPCLYDAISLRMIQDTILERLGVKMRKRFIFLQLCGPEMHYYQTIRRKRLWKSSEWKRIVQSFWDRGKPWCPQGIPCTYNLINSYIIGDGSNQTVVSRLKT